MRILGIMSGTSLDGVDYVLCRIDSPDSISFAGHWSVPYPQRLKSRLHSAASNQSVSYELGELHHDLGRFYASAAPSVKTDLVGLHGQTVFHSPRRATLQIGEPAYLAEALGVPVISNFRSADIAAGGEGAPLATLFHRHVFAQKGSHIAVNNLGGISNVTSLDWRRRKEPRMIAFDTGPANILLDMAVRHLSRGRRAFDRGGALASKGKVHDAVLRNLLKHRYFSMNPPKSTGREEFGEPLFKKLLLAKLSPSDLLATLTEVTARSIALSYERFLPAIPDEVVLCGGGALNPFLYARIATALRELKSNIGVHGSEEFGWHPLHIEAAAFALLAWLLWHGKPGNSPATTGAAGPRLLGQINFGKKTAGPVRLKS
jgi:anhydro-N-acetylmuramic acid kinase